MELKSFIRDVPDFPISGVTFKDISPLLEAPEVFNFVIDQMALVMKQRGVTKIVAIDSRGFIFGAPVARELRLPLVLVRKPGKLPSETVSVSYNLEYGSGSLEVHRDAVGIDSRVAIVDDVLATGGTAEAAGRLVRLVGGKVVLNLFLLELGFLGGRGKLVEQGEIVSLLNYG
jgi:adenine phosphoribosyltransferase